MKWSIVATSFLCFLVLFQPGGQPRAHGQQGQQTARVEEKSAHGKEGAKWQTVDDIHVLKVWELEGADVYPQVAVLRVSDKVYRNFSENPKEFREFLNKYNIFPKAVRTVGPWVTLSSVDESDDPSCWILAIVHGHMSRALASAVPCLQ